MTKKELREIAKQLIKENSTQKYYSKILEIYREATEYSQPKEQVKRLTTALAEFFNDKLKSM